MSDDVAVLVDVETSVVEEAFPSVLTVVVAVLVLVSVLPEPLPPLKVSELLLLRPLIILTVRVAKLWFSELSVAVYTT